MAPWKDSKSFAQPHVWEAEPDQCVQRDFPFPTPGKKEQSTAPNPQALRIERLQILAIYQECPACLATKQIHHGEWCQRTWELRDQIRHLEQAMLQTGATPDRFWAQCSQPVPHRPHQPHGFFPNPLSLNKQIVVDDPEAKKGFAQQQQQLVKLNRQYTKAIQSLAMVANNILIFPCSAHQALETKIRQNTVAWKRFTHECPEWSGIHSYGGNKQKF